MHIAIQGQPASFHDQAAHLFFAGQKVTTQSFETFAETFAALDAKKVDCAVVAIENSIHGAINETFDLMRQYQFWMVGELYLRIEQCLIGLSGAKLHDITDVYSHFAALSQCRTYLANTLPQAKLHEHHDTAGAVMDIKKWGNPHKAAIASAYAANYYSLPTLAKGIETDTHNYTRFALLRREHITPPNATKTSLLVQLHSKPGALYEVLGILAAHNLDLTMIVSRPVIGKPGDYQFYIDVTAPATDKTFLQAIAAIAAAGSQVRILGSYLSHNALVK